LLRELETGTYIEPHRMSVSEYMSRWLEATKSKVEERTWVRYEQIVRNQIVPTLGHMKLGQLRPLHIEKAEAEWAERGNRRTRVPSALSARSVLHIHRCLHTAMDRAVKWRLLAVNPVDGVDAPHVPQSEAESLTPAEAVKLIEILRGRSYELPMLIGLIGGLRPTEYLALRWRDVDLERAELRVRQNVHRERADRVTEHMGVQVPGFRFGPPKTHRSRRPVSLPLEFCAVLKLWRKAQAELRVKAKQWHDLDLVFADGSGLPHKLQQVELDFAKARTLADLRPEVRLYDLRHTMASLLLYLGKSLKLIAARLGHASETLVLTTYGHLQPTDDREAAEELWNVTRRLHVPDEEELA
jgi:integrase